MTFVPPKPGGWTTNDALTSTQVTALQAGIIAADADVIAEHRRNLTRAHRLKTLNLVGVTPTSTIGVLGVCSSDSGRDVLCVKDSANGVFSFGDTDLAILSGITVADLNGECCGLLFGGGRHLAFGIGTTHKAFSTNNGANWTAGGASTMTSPVDRPQYGVWDGTEFILASLAGDTEHSTNGVTWTNAGGADDIGNVFDVSADAVGGLAALSNGTVVATGLIGGVAGFAASSDHGASWADNGGSIATPANYAERGYIGGRGSTELYWVGSNIVTGRVDLFVSSDGITWTKRSEITGLPTLSSSSPSIFVCQDTGLLVVRSSTAGGITINVSDDAGLTWSSHLFFNLTSNFGIGVARGRLFASIGARFFASDGIDL